MTTAEVAAEPEQVRVPVRVPPVRVPRWAAVAMALAAGGTLLLAFPPFGLWWCAPVGVASLVQTMR